MAMDAFAVHKNLIEDYKSFTEGFVEIRDTRIRESVLRESANGAQWPDPWLALNPSFESGGSVDELVAQGILHPESARVFRHGKATGHGSPVVFHRHQRDAIEIAQRDESYVLTTGTGSGKSLSYIVPIVDHVLRKGSGTGLKAIIVYPMNALANSQMEELRKFLCEGYPAGQEPVTFERYTGQDQEDVRERVLNNPPDILLTNYVMLELMLTRPRERRALMASAHNLKFLVLDELHTYRGRQGADVAMLVRRVRQASGVGDDLQCVGTSATMATATTLSGQRAEVSEVASRLFGTNIPSANVVTETLIPATTQREPSEFALLNAVQARSSVESYDPNLEAGYATLRSDPLAGWIEDTFGLNREPESGVLVRSRPTTVQRAAEILAEITGESSQSCETAIRQTLIAGSRALNSAGRPLFAFRLHQFLSKGSSVYVSAESEDKRFITHDYQVTTLGNDGKRRKLFPLAFCRECGQEYLMVTRNSATGSYTPRVNMTLRSESSTGKAGYLFIDSAEPWNENDLDRLPESWKEDSPAGAKIKPSKRKYVPQATAVGLEGEIGDVNLADDYLTSAAFISGSLQFCLRCGVTYQSRMSEISKLSTMDQEGRSSASTVISTSIIRSLNASDMPKEVRKLLTFVDNRQDASLQAGHVNDFVLVAQLRGAIYRAVKNNPRGIQAIHFADHILSALNIDREFYAQKPNAFDTEPADSAMRKVLELRATLDLKRGWRITLPNLEQTGLVAIEYPTVRRLCEADDYWQATHPAWRNMRPEKRYELLKVLLDEMRRVLAIESDALSDENIDRLKRLSREHLTGIWTVDEHERFDGHGYAYIGTKPKNSKANSLSISARSSYGKWLRQQLSELYTAIDGAETVEVIQSAVKLLEENNLLSKHTSGEVSGYRIKLGQITLFEGNGDFATPDPLRRNTTGDRGLRVIPFFRDLYKDGSEEFAGLLAREHTAQVRQEDRQERETDFRKGDLKLLYCSPTMELGVDISSLNAVSMRNVPPTPANYAQRSGRAGRSGQPAVVVTYCASGNAHDSYYFKRSDLMVAGQVQPPRLDLGNEELIRSHVHSLWLAETGLSLSKSMRDIVDPEHELYPLRPEIVDAIQGEQLKKRVIYAAKELLVPLAEELKTTNWWHEEWIERTVSYAPTAFDHACERWRALDRITVNEMAVATKLMSDSSSHVRERRDAETRLKEASRQRTLLLNDGRGYSEGDFYPYRYFASEGFLPGYSFPRLPLAAYIPGVQGAGATWLQRPRFLALREFGPKAFIYHEGARYMVERINLPRNGDDAGSDIALTDMYRCESCAVHVSGGIGADVCENCGQPLGASTKNLLQLQTVVTRRRDRISSDEEERQRAGYEMVTSYRYQPRGSHPGFQRAYSQGNKGKLLEFTYGENAEIRVTNMGYRAEVQETTPGFWLDPVKGKWLSNQAADEIKEGVDDFGEDSAEEVRRKVRVIPFVEDYRNLANVRWLEDLSTGEAASLMFALERGMEALFQLEDSELTAEMLPNSREVKSFLFVEAAEGGAGVLKRLALEPDLMAEVARKALDIIHVDPDTGEDAPDSDPCDQACYRCLLSYGNQLFHGFIDRKSARGLLMDLAQSTTEPEGQPTYSGQGNIQQAGQAVNTALSGAPDSAPSSPPDSPPDSPPVAAPSVPAVFETSALGRAFMHYLSAQGLNSPVDGKTVTEGIAVDLVFPHNVAVVCDSAVDASMLAFLGWQVINVHSEDDFERVVAENPRIFGKDMS